MNPPRLLLRLILLTLVGGCAVQNAASGYGDESDDAAVSVDDVKAPTFDLPTVDPDVGSSEVDTGKTPADPDVGFPEPDTGVVTPVDVPRVRDVVVPPPDLGGPTVVCGSRTTCDTCTAETSCGWCALTARCIDGTASGPTGTACAMGWAWVASACTTVDPCNAATTCGTCAAQSGCGWCGASNRCVTANTARSSPATGTCGSAWSGTVAACTAPPPDPCNRYTQCGDCAAAAACGWCRSSRRCMTGTGTGPNPTYGTCTSWAYVSSQCTTPGDSCASSSGCGSCTNRGSCGWCGDSNTCHSGSSSGPTDGACRGGSWTWTNIFGICF